MFEDIEYRPSKVSAPEGRYKRRLIDNFPAGDIDDNCSTVE